MKNLWKKLSAMFLSAAVIVLPTGAVKARAAVSMEEELLFADIPVVYAASRTNESIQTAASNITVITAQQIKDWGLRDLADATHLVPGFAIAYDRDEWVFQARGVSSDNTTNFMMSIDGQPVNMFSGWGVSHIMDLPNDLSNVKQIEFIKGPGSVTWGNEAPWPASSTSSPRTRATTRRKATSKASTAPTGPSIRATSSSSRSPAPTPITSSRRRRPTVRRTDEPDGRFQQPSDLRLRARALGRSRRHQRQRQRQRLPMADAHHRHRPPPPQLQGADQGPQRQLRSTPTPTPCSTRSTTSSTKSATGGTTTCPASSSSSRANGTRPSSPT